MGASSDSPSPSFAGLRAKPAKPAPPLALDDSLGHRVNIDSYRGKAVLVLFIYTHCPDVCPLMVGHLHTALHELGSEASEVQIIAVSVDPRGDTPLHVKRFLVKQHLTGRMRYLVGSRAQLAPVWRAYGIRPQGKGYEHTASTVIVDGAGRQRVGYLTDQLTPEALADDLRALADGARATR